MGSSVWDKVKTLNCYHSLRPCANLTYKNIERHAAHIIVSRPNPQQWVIVHTSDLMMIIRQSNYLLPIITKKMGKLKTHSPTYCIMNDRENMLNLTHTLDKLYLTYGITCMVPYKLENMKQVVYGVNNRMWVTGLIPFFKIIVAQATWIIDEVLKPSNQLFIFNFRLLLPIEYHLEMAVTNFTDNYIKCLIDLVQNAQRRWLKQYYEIH